ncbi:hypothetical protein D8I35_09370 [Corticibacter populi]|uniref:DUF2570 domain-containing protein n=1 Tax=Corticibacter populi TaxID=1550736 RepID=A0A3M6QUJ8_9BURK|nr:hypothetical protein [Corticibacter populi]RMX06700.1 hypothetical protein D8I35_09370 [Corticibacter populi]RZS31719.1 hypothetical protein EV687_2388 [Corticibacter populi]
MTISTMRAALVLLAVSALANVVQAWQYLGQRDTLAELRRDLAEASAGIAQARAAVDMCSASIDEMATAAAALEDQLEQARKQAQAAASQRYARADQILSAPAAVPGDVCASAQARVRDILAGRARGGEQ